MDFRKSASLFCLFFIAFSGKVIAQTGSDLERGAEFYRNSVYVELFGNAWIGSVNYERLFRIKHDPLVAMRLGGLVLPDRYGFITIVPAEISFINGKRDLKFEYGFGMTFVHYFERERPYDDVVIEVSHTWLPVFRLGARYQPAGKPYFMRVAFTPHFVSEVEGRTSPMMPWGGLSFGYSFGKK